MPAGKPRMTEQQLSRLIEAASANEGRLLVRAEEKKRRDLNKQLAQLLGRYEEKLRMQQQAAQAAIAQKAKRIRKTKPSPPVQKRIVRRAIMAKPARAPQRFNYGSRKYISGGIKMPKKTQKPGKKRPIKWANRGIATNAEIRAQVLRMRAKRPEILLTKETGFRIRSRTIGPKRKIIRI